MFETYLGAPRNFAFKPVVLHADLSRDHVLMANNAVSGVIDFGDVNRGDPDYDFMYLFVDFGLAFTLDVARRYGHADLGRLQDKLRYYGIVDQIGTIREDQGRSLPGHKEKAWQRLREFLIPGARVIAGVRHPRSSRARS